MGGLHGAKGNRAKREYVPEIDIDAREDRAGDGGDEGVVLESLQVLLSSLRVVAQKVEMALDQIRRGLVDKKGPRCAGRCVAVRASEGLHHTDTGVYVDECCAAHETGLSQGSTGPTDASRLTRLIIVLMIVCLSVKGGQNRVMVTT
jgi:hypothetical protein